MSSPSVHRVDFGYFIRPADETGTGVPRVEPCFGYVIDHPDGILLVDTGMGADPDVDDHYRPVRRHLGDAVHSLGFDLEDVRYIVNCHLHFDHCGGNPTLADRTFYVQRIELETARSTGSYTLPQLVDPPGLHYEVLDGEAEVLDGVVIIPTPGHTDGHQSVVVTSGDGTVVVAGQCHDSATAYAADVLALRARQEGDPDIPVITPAWLERLQVMDPRRVVFAHDQAVWEPLLS
jgi:N-acyl homoserine lactone hydrolase